MRALCTQIHGECMDVERIDMMQQLDKLDVVLMSKGFPQISDWWRDTFRRWYTSGKKQLTVRCGRRGGKSSSFCRLAVCEALYNEHKIPPGDVGVVAVVSARRTEALERLRTIRAILDALGEEYTAKVESIELKSRPVVFAIYTASIAGVSGFTAIFVLCDEVAKWRDAATGANPANEVIGSIRPTLATQRNAKIALSSSPMGKLDAHALAFADGETALQCVAYAPTWIANPSVTEEETRALEPNPLVWSREYEATPQDEDETSILTSAMLARVTRASVTVHAERDVNGDLCDRHFFAAALDLRSEPWALVVGCLTDGSVRRVAAVYTCETFQEVQDIIRPYGLKHVASSDFAETSMREIARAVKLGLVTSSWKTSDLSDAYAELRTLAQGKRLELPNDPTTRAALLGIRTHGAGYTADSNVAPCIAMLVPLLRVPPKPLPLTPEEEKAAFDTSFLLEREKAAKRERRLGAMPVTHTRFRR